MTNETAYITTHDRISPDADLFADEAELRAYLAEMAAEDPDPDRGWVQVAETLEVREGTVYADVGDGLVEIAEQVRTTTVDEALTDASREDIAATVEELEGLPALRCPVTIGSTDPDLPELIVVDPYRRQPINAGLALEEARAYLEPDDLAGRECPDCGSQLKRDWGCPGCGAEWDELAEEEEAEESGE